MQIQIQMEYKTVLVLGIMDEDVMLKTSTIYQKLMH